MDTRNSLIICAIMEKAETDPMFKARLLTEPEAVAAEHKVKFDDDAITHLKKIGDLIKLTDEVRASLRHGPIYYPPVAWLERRFYQIPKPPPPGYYFDVERFKEFLEFKQVQKQLQIQTKTATGGY